MSNSAAPFSPEPGAFNNVFLGDDGQVVKTTRFTFPTAEEADIFCDRLEEYHAALAAGPLAVADLLAVDILDVGDGTYRVRHETSRVDGPSLAEMPFNARRQATADLLGTVAQLPRQPGNEGRLATPLDAKPRNFRGERPVLIDVCPPFYWDESGFVATGAGDVEVAARQQMTRRFGELSGPLAELLIGLAPSYDEASGISGTTHLRRVADTVSEWTAGVLPVSISPEVRGEVAAKLAENIAAQSAVVARAETAITELQRLLSGDL